MTSVSTKTGLLVSLLLLASCGGGDGVVVVGMSLSRDSLSFSARTETTLPSSQKLTMRVIGPVAQIAFDADGGGPLPDWLELDGFFTGPETLELDIGITRTDLVESVYTSTITFYALDDQDNVRHRVSLQVTYEVHGRVEFLSDSSLSADVAWGHDSMTTTVAAGVAALGESWQVTSDTPWITVDESVRADSGTISVGIDASALTALGVYNGSLRIANVNEPLETDTIAIRLFVRPPRFTFSTLHLGGADGYGDAPGALNFSLDTGTNTYPWTAAVSFSTTWVEIDRASGSVGGAGDSIMVDPDPVGLDPGGHSGFVRFETVVRGVTVTGSAIIRIQVQENQLHVVDNGLALYELPNRTRLSADVPVRESRGRLDTPWTAQADQPWLAVTPSGVTGGNLTVTADTSGLAADVVHIATVTIVPGDPSVHNEQERVTVSLWKSATPAANLALEIPVERVAANPALPYFHVFSDGVVSTYNIYTGALVWSATLPAPTWDGLTVTSDGRTLVAARKDFGLPSRVDVLTGTVTQGQTILRPAKPERWRIEGHSFLYEWPCCFMFGATDYALTADGHRVFSISNRSLASQKFYSVQGADLDYTVLGGTSLTDGLFLGPEFDDSGLVSDAALAEDRRSLLLATTEPSEFRLVDGITRQRVWTKSVVGTANNVLVRSDGLLVAGANAEEGATDVWLFDLDGTVLAELSSPAGALLRDELELSSDRHRLLVPTDADRLDILELPALGPDLAP